MSLMKKVLGLDLGTNSIGWAVINVERNGSGDEVFSRISGAGSRIIPMDQETIGNFNKGNSKSQTAERTAKRSARRLYERGHLRRERLNRVLATLGWLPEHYLKCLDEYGKLLPGLEPKIAWADGENGRCEFLFKEAFLEMMEDFRKNNPDILSESKKIPYDWTLYYLRKKALSTPLSNQELAWVLSSFNQKRGYYQLRGEDNETENKNEEYLASKVIKIEDTGEKKGAYTRFNIIFENGHVYPRTLKEAPDWEGKVKELIVTTTTGKNGEIKRSYRMPGEDDWQLLKKKTENDIEKSQKTVGEYIYDSLRESPDSKIRGRLVRTVDREYYRDELERILDCQMKFNADLRNTALYDKCILKLYPSNTAYRNSIAGRGFKYLFVNDIIFYQRPLKSKKSMIADCPFEERHYTKDGQKCTSHLKCIPRSNPLFQEFRLWQFISNLRIYEKECKVAGTVKENVDVTSAFLPDKGAVADLFCWMNDKEQITQYEFLSYPGFGLSQAARKNYRWNYIDDPKKKYPANETRAAMLGAFSKAGISEDFLTPEIEYRLWHILYSVKDKEELHKALKKFAVSHNLPDKFVEVFVKHHPYDNDYGAYSEKAVRRLLALMRAGKYWRAEVIDESTKTRIGKLITGEYDEKIKDRVREKAISLLSIEDFQGLPVWLASYIVYNRHSEIKETSKWTSPEDIDEYLSEVKQHSLRNPIVESVIMETLRTVRDIWKAEGHIDEIHVELGREMKNPADKRKQITERALENENANLRIRALLTEFLNPEYDIAGVKPNSPSQQEKMRIYEDEVLQSIEDNKVSAEIRSILDKFSQSDPKKKPTHSDIVRYKAWLEQKYRSPYTGRVIPLGKLFTPAYEIEHIIPQSVYFDDSFSNKVICESEVNKLKDNTLAYPFIKEHQGETVTLTGGATVSILSVEAYEKFVKEHYGSRAGNAKRQKLLADEIPEGFIQRQLNDSRYISKVIKTLLSNIVREKDEEEAISKNVITCNGSITDKLKKDWGLKDVWKGLVMPRFERMDEKYTDEDYTAINANGKKVPVVPFKHQKGFDLKRIDHRHHAMDAIVIACASRNIVNYLNNSSACRGAEVKRYDLQHLLCDKTHQDDKGNYQWIIKKPSPNFVSDVNTTLKNCIVSFKQSLRIINKTSNYYEKIVDGKKIRVKQEKGDNWAIRKSMHKDTVFGEVDLRFVKEVSVNEALKHPDRIVRKDIKAILSSCRDEKTMKAALKEKFPDMTKLEIYSFAHDTNDHYYASRVALSPDFKKETIEKVTDSGIRAILLRHLEQYEGDPSQAFSPDGIDKMNANIAELNGGKPHKPIFRVRKYEKADKFHIGETGCKSQKFVEADKGTNLFFGVYRSENGKRSYASIPLIEAIGREKDGFTPVPETDKNGNRLLFALSPNDLVYIPTPDEIERGIVDGELDRERIYKMVSCTGSICLFIPSTVAKSIVDKSEFSSLNKMERAITGEMIKEICIPLKVDRLGEIVDFNGRLL